MKTIKNLFFSMATLVALSVSFTSCTDALSKEVEVKAPAIDFSIGGEASAPMQKVGAATEVVWLDEEVDISAKLSEELEKSNLTLDNVKGLKITGSMIQIQTVISTAMNFGNIKLYIDGVQVATALASISVGSTEIDFVFASPYDIFGKLGAGKVQVKITSDQPKPSIKLDMKLFNTYLGKVSLI